MLNIFFVLGELVIVASAVAFFLADKLYAFLPEQYALLLLENKWYLLIVGIVLSVLGMVQHVFKKYKATTAQQLENTHHSNQQTKSEFLSSESGVFKVDKNQLHAARQSSEALISIAASTDWQPLKEGGTNFKSMQLLQVASHRIETKHTKQGYMFAAVFLFLGVLGMFFTLRHIMTIDNFSWSLLVPLCITFIFSAIGMAFWYFPRPRIFDKHTGWFWLGSPKLTQSAEISQSQQAYQLSQITALQIIDEYISSTNSNGHSSSSFHSYELNMVLKDGSRFNVMDHGDKDSLMADARMLSEFLAVPILE